MSGIEHRPSSSPAAASGESATERVCVVAILRDELPFVHEWLAYHRLLGADHFILYDDDPALPLGDALAPHAPYVTVVEWHGKSTGLPGRNRQTKAYLHALSLMESAFTWVSYLDGDEFIVLKRRPTLHAFLADFTDCEAVSLNWHCFGNGRHVNDPADLVISSLTRRAIRPSPRHKSITRVRAIRDIFSAHSCILAPGSRWVDVHGRPYSDAMYRGKTDPAHINHYMCRSFRRWMHRPVRGDVGFDGRVGIGMDPRDRWKLSRPGCLWSYVSNVMIQKNHHGDRELQPYRQPVLDYLEGLGQSR